MVVMGVGRLVLLDAGFDSRSSFPRKREPSAAIAVVLDWVPAFAGMTIGAAGMTIGGAGLTLLTRSMTMLTRWMAA